MSSMRCVNGIPARATLVLARLPGSVPIDTRVRVRIFYQAVSRAVRRHGYTYPAHSRALRVNVTSAEESSRRPADGAGI
jgi:hypothetical protein